MQYTKDGNKVIYDDVMNGLSSIPNESIDLIFADPPYNIGKNFNGLIEKWDQDYFLKWCYEWIKECYRVLKPNGTFYQFSRKTPSFRTGRMSNKK